MLKSKPYFVSGFYIFVKDEGKLSYSEILNEFGLSSYKIEVDSKLSENRNYSKVYLKREKLWIHLMDDCSYNLYESEIILKGIESLGRKYDLFYCSIGDIDNSFHFEYYKNGALERKYVAADPDFDEKKLVIKENIGERLPIEQNAFQKKDRLEKIIIIASSLGINTTKEIGKIRCYKSECPINDEFFFFDDEK